MNYGFLLTAIYTMWGIMDIACLNGNGLREINKVKRLIGILKADIICLQETHWSEDIMENIKKIWKRIFLLIMEIKKLVVWRF